MPEPTPFRLLVTGSRTWRDAHAVTFALDAASLDALGREVIVVHGACEEGADLLADRAARDLGFTVEPHPADWESPCRPECKPGHRRRRRDGTDYCPAAGNYRNEEMVRLGADVCLCFVMPCARPGWCSRRGPHDSHGASDCAERAEKAGIPVRRFRP